MEEVIVEPDRIEVRIRQRSNFKYRTEFIGAGGKVLSQSMENTAVYQRKGDEQYVRAKVFDSGGGVAWVQPVFIRKN